MNCTACKELLVLHLDGSLDDSQSRAVIEHVERCPSCRAELESMQGLHDRLVSNGNALAGSDLENEVMNRIIREQNVRLKTAAQASASLRIRRLLMNNTTKRIAAAAVIVLAVVLGFSVLPNPMGGTAYARAVGLLQRAATMTYSVVTTTGIETMPTVRTEIAFKEPGHMRTSTVDGYITVVDASDAGVRGITMVPDQRQYMMFEFSNAPDKSSSDPLMSVERMRTLPTQADEACGQRTIDGRLLEGYRVYGDDATCTVWIDPVSGQLARAELEYPNAPGMNMILSDFQFDIPLDDSLFSLEPPAGYTPNGVELTADLDEIVEADLVEYLRMWSSWTVDNIFPPTLTGTELAKVAMRMGQEGRFATPVPQGYEPDQVAQIMYNGMAFMGKLPEGSWRYAGQGVAFGDPATPVFWYQPQGSEVYRVVYADLHIEEVAPEDLPQ